MKNLYKIEIEGTVKYMFGNHTGNIINDLTNADMGYKNTSIEKVCAVNDILNVDAFVRAENEQIEALVKEAIKKIENKSSTMPVVSDCENVKSKCCNAKIIPDDLIGGEYCDSCKDDC